MGFDGRQPEDNPPLEIIEDLRAKLAAAEKRSLENYERWVRDGEEAEARETALRCELAAERNDNQAITEALAKASHGQDEAERERDTLRAELAALEKTNEENFMAAQRECGERLVVEAERDEARAKLAAERERADKAEAEFDRLSERMRVRLVECGVKLDEAAKERDTLRAARAAVIEECARAAENHYLHEPMFVIERESAFSIARAIRALKETKP